MTLTTKITTRNAPMDLTPHDSIGGEYTQPLVHQGNMNDDGNGQSPHARIDGEYTQPLVHQGNTDGDENVQNGLLASDGDDNECQIEASDTGQRIRECMHYVTEAEHENTVDEKNTADTTLETTKAPDGGWGWFIVLGCIILRMSAAGLARSHGLFYIQFRDRYNESATATTWVMSLAGTLRLAIGPVVSILCIRFSTRQLTCVGTCFMFGGLLVSSFAPNMQFFYFSYGVLVGIGRAFILTPCPILIGYYFDKRRSLAYGLASTGFGLGGLVVTPAVQTMFEEYGFRGTFLVLSAIVTHVFVASALFRPIEQNRKRDSKRRQPQNVDYSPAELDHLDKNDKSIDASKQQCDIHVETDVHPDYQSDVPTVKEIDTVHSCVAVSNNEHLLSEKAKPVICSNSSIVSTVKSKTGWLQTLCEKCKCTKTSTAHKRDGNTFKVSFSVLKDVRFLTYAIASFCLILPRSTLFLPALAKSRGLTDMQAAYLLSIMAGTDTLFRVISGFILNFKMFRKVRPLVFNGLIFMQVIVSFVYPSVSTFAGFVTLGICEGAIIGTRNAQGSVVIVDILGIDKLASSMVFTMSFQLLGHLIGPTVSAQLKDIYGTYDGAFYFAGTAVMIGGLIMAGGNIRKIWTDRRARKNTNI